jgi:hypothetical protein
VAWDRPWPPRVSDWTLSKPFGRGSTPRGRAVYGPYEAPNQPVHPNTPADVLFRCEHQFATPELLRVFSSPGARGPVFGGIGRSRSPPDGG